MEFESILAKIEVLIEQKKLTEAEAMLRDLISQDPNNVNLLVLMAQLCLKQDNIQAAQAAIESALALAPDESMVFQIKARVEIEQKDFDAALTSLNKAIELNPTEPNHFALLSNLYLNRKMFDESLKQADLALELDPENLLALNMRSAALLKLNKKEQSFQTIEGALREDPNNPYTHANYGWGLLEKGDHKKALIHFQESLKNDPQNESARYGMLEAIKASNPFYRLFLKYSFWMSNMTSSYQWGVLIGFYVLQRFLIGAANENSDLKLFLVPLVYLLGFIAFSTWIIDPISNLFLRFNKYGKILLEKHQKTSSNFVAVSLGICLLGFLLYLSLANDAYLSLVVFGFGMMVPLGVVFLPIPKQRLTAIYTLAMTLIGLSSVVSAFTTSVYPNSITGYFFLSFILFQVFYNFLTIKANNP
jgi:tetratricopeptide (TPR) repeat protein